MGLGILLVWLCGEGAARLGTRCAGLPLPEARRYAAWAGLPWVMLALGPVLAPLFSRLGGKLALDVLGAIQWPGRVGFYHLTPAQYLYLLWAGPWFTLSWLMLFGLGVWQGVRRLSGVATGRLIQWPVLLALGFLFYLGLSAWTTTVYPPTGDEPHYLMMTHSLLHGHGLDLTSVMRDQEYHRFYPGRVLDFHGAPSPTGQLISKHFPLISFLMVPGYALLGRFGAALLMLLCASGIAVLLFYFARLRGASEAQALLVWALALACPPLGTYFDLIYTELPASLCLMLGVWAWLRGGTRGLWGAALAAALLPWFYPKYIPLSLGLGCLLPWTREAKPAQWTGPAAMIAFSALGFIKFFYGLYGYGLGGNPFGELHPYFSKVAITHALGLLVDRDFGLIAASPVMLASLLGLTVHTQPRRFWIAAWGALAIEFALYVSFDDFTGSASVFSRHLLPGALLLLAALPQGWEALRRAWPWGKYLIWVLISASVGTTWICAACPMLRYLAPKQQLWAKLSLVPSMFPTLASLPGRGLLLWGAGMAALLLGLFIWTWRRAQKRPV